LIGPQQIQQVCFNAAKEITGIEMKYHGHFSTSKLPF
jgi:hypothetical protein